ncbi:hypothetical protein SAMN02910370_01565 [Lachnospiraceae bacterium XPB1003]|nr:hypothetical protein SAMN02910370_01565 [Lachnospiraceae bacterium XPB1003]
MTGMIFAGTGAEGMTGVAAGMCMAGALGQNSSGAQNPSSVRTGFFDGACINATLTGWARQLEDEEKARATSELQAKRSEAPEQDPETDQDNTSEASAEAQKETEEQSAQEAEPKAEAQEETEEQPAAEEQEETEEQPAAEAQKETEEQPAQGVQKEQ